MSDKANNIILIGMPASGKSTIGVLLAKRLLRGFIDTDVYIQSAQGRGLQEIIDTNGLDFFSRIEEKQILSIDAKNTVIATGGSVVYSGKAMEKLSTDSTVVYLDLPIEEIKRRLTDIGTRGVVMEKHQTIESLYNERQPLYAGYADIKINCAGLNHEQTLDAVASALLVAKL